MFSRDEFKRWARARVVLVEIDQPDKKPLPEAVLRQNAELRKQYGVNAFPTIYLIDADGKRISNDIRTPPSVKLRKRRASTAERWTAGVDTLLK